MSIKTRASNRLLGIVLIALTLYLGLYTWNARTGVLNTLAERSGLEAVGYVLAPFDWVKENISYAWEHYFALVGVAEENTRLREELKRAEMDKNLTREERAELTRLRRFFSIDALKKTSGFGARVIAKQFGPMAVLKTMTVDKGYLDGAITGTAVVVPEGVVGKVLRAAPNAATVLLITDADCRIAVVSQETRTPAVVTGVAGDGNSLDVRYVGQVATLKSGELLVTSGVDGQFPKGIPVGRVTSVEAAVDTLFLAVQAQPMVPLDNLEEVIMLLPPDNGPPLIAPVIGPMEPPPGFVPDTQRQPVAPSSPAS